jgi:hypothetical protein
MSDSLATPWHVRHKGALIALGALSAVATVLGVNFRSDIRPILGASLSRVGSWMGNPHQVAGWLLLLLIVTGCFGILVGIVLLWAFLVPSSSAKMKAYAVTLEKIQWHGWINQDGRVVGVPVPHCPLCHCELRDEIDLASGAVFYECDDCKKTLEMIYGGTREITDRIIRRIEAQWRRGELFATKKGSKQGPGSLVASTQPLVEHLEEQP